MTAIKNEASSFAMSALGVIADIADPVSCPLMTDGVEKGLVIFGEQ